MVPVVSYSLPDCLYSVRGVYSVLQCLVVSTTVLLVCTLFKLSGAYGVLLCLIVSVAVSL